MKITVTLNIEDSAQGFTALQKILVGADALGEVVTLPALTGRVMEINTAYGTRDAAFSPDRTQQPPQVVDSAHTTIQLA